MWNIIEVSMCATIHIVTIIILRSLFVNNVKKNVLVFLWYTAIARLVFPFSFFMPGSKVFNAIAPKVLSTNNTFTVVKNIGNVFKKTNESPDILQHSFSVSKNANHLLIGIWLVISFLLFAAIFLKHFYYVQKLSTATLIKNPAIDGFIHKMNFRRQITVKESPFVNSPLTYGLIHPKIIFPENFDLSNSTHNEYILMHELTHISRFDILLKWILIIILCVYWFNPFIWCMYALCNRDIEMCCDEAVIKKIGSVKKKNYAILLVSLEAGKRQAFSVFGDFGKNAIEERIIAIMKIQNSKRTLITTISTCLIAGFTLSLTVFAESSLFKVQNGSNSFTPIIKNNVIMGPTDTINTDIMSGCTVDTNEEVISPDGGETWYIGNSYKDPITNLTYYFEEDGRKISPDDGNTWYDDYFMDYGIITCTRTETLNDTTEINYYAISKDLGQTWEHKQETVNWFTYEEYRSYVIETINNLNYYFNNHIPLLDSENNEYYLSEDDLHEQIEDLMNNLSELKNGNMQISTDFKYIGSIY